MQDYDKAKRVYASTSTEGQCQPCDVNGACNQAVVAGRGSARAHSSRAQMYRQAMDGVVR
jgi:hypothetical protein